MNTLFVFSPYIINHAYGTPYYTAKTKTGDLVSISHDDDGTYNIHSEQTRKTASADTFAEACSVFVDWLDYYTVLVRGCAIDVLAGAYTIDEAALVGHDRHGDLEFAIAKNRENNKSILADMAMTLEEV